MPFQYIHTSAKRGLEPGKSGFCCVARDRDTPPDLIKELERLSSYESTAGAISPVILRMTMLETRNGSYRILSRIQDSGVDYSKRNNHIAHHIVFTPEEVSLLPDPATILLSWKGWKDSWESPPCILSEKDNFNILDLENINTYSDHSNRFATLESAGTFLTRSLLVAPGEEIPVTIWFRNQLQRVPSELRWEFPFTSFLLSSDKPADFAWSCNWHERELPYELELEGKPWHIQKTDSSPAAPAILEIPSDDMLKESPSPPKKFAAPRVEIPKELDRSKLKRPKPKWTPNRFNKTINLSLFFIAIICIAVIVFFIKVIKKTDFEATDLIGDTTTQPEESANVESQPSDSEHSQEDLQQGWQELVDQQLLYGAKERAREIASKLANFGNNTPSEYLAFLDQTSAGSQTVPVPSHSLVSELDVIQIDPNLAAYLQDEQYHFVPQKLSDTIQQIVDLHATSSAIYDRLSSHSFQGEDFTIGLRALRRKLSDDLKSEDIAAWVAAQSYDDAISEVFQDPKLLPYLSIHVQFEKSQNKGFIALDAAGLVSNGQDLSYKTFAVSLFENYVLPRYSRFEPNSSFSAALKRLENNPNSLRYVYEAMLASVPKDRDFKSQWQSILSVWRNAFVRSDLMEETLVNYAIEQIEESKRELLSLQTQFQADDLARYRSLKTLEPLLEQAILQAEAANIQEEWIVIPSQIAQRRSSE